MVQETVSNVYESAKSLLGQTLYEVDETSLVIQQVKVTSVVLDLSEVVVCCLGSGMYHFYPDGNFSRPKSGGVKLFFNYKDARDYLVQLLDDRKKSLQEAIY